MEVDLGRVEPFKFDIEHVHVLVAAIVDIVVLAPLLTTLGAVCADCFSFHHGYVELVWISMRRRCLRFFWSDRVRTPQFHKQNKFLECLCSRDSRF